MHPDSMMENTKTASPPQSHMHGAVTRVDVLVSDIEHVLENLQARLEPVVFHRPSEVPDTVGPEVLGYAPLAGEIHNLADRLVTIRDSLGHTLASLEV